MSPSLASRATRESLFGPEDSDFLEQVARLAEDYPFPHSIFGGPESEDYVLELAARHTGRGEGWYGAALDDENLAAVHLSVYGIGNGRNHTLFKIRHPLLAGEDGPTCLSMALESAVEAAAAARPGTQKHVIFLGEQEQDALHAGRRAGFTLEGIFSDYYRLGERCFVLGYTEASAS
ncbi:MAG: hypothetical protein SX243_00285 [Acidobacteriota bacterium]|nr:hypothetical protein [Acidobacteriota bacterium]